MLYNKFNNQQLIFLEQDVGVKIEEREYSKEEREQIEEQVVDYMGEHASVEPEPDEIARKCEAILDLLNE